MKKRCRVMIVVRFALVMICWEWLAKLVATCPVLTSTRQVCAYLGAEVKHATLFHISEEEVRVQRRPAYEYWQRQILDTTPRKLQSRPGKGVAAEPSKLKILHVKTFGSW